MPVDLKEAWILAKKVRFFGDSIKVKSDDVQPFAAQQMRSILSQDALEVTSLVTPDLANNINLVLERLSIPKKVVSAFVYSSAEPQASCFAGSITECVISFSSGLIKLLKGVELQFVIGHEIGHFLLGHNILNSREDNESPEYLIQQRAQEISADRLGLLACQSLEAGVRAMMKTVSGLSDEHLRYDTKIFLEQLQSATETSLNMTELSTHPSCLMRCRALLWFSMDHIFLYGKKRYSREALRKLDNRIEKDMHRFVDGRIRHRIAKVKGNVVLWLTAFEMIKDGRFDQDEQTIFSHRFGGEVLKKVLSLFDGMSKNEAVEIVEIKLRHASQELEAIMPNGYEREMTNIRRSISVKT